MSDNNNS